MVEFEACGFRGRRGGDVVAVADEGGLGLFAVPGEFQVFAFAGEEGGRGGVGGGSGSENVNAVSVADFGGDGGEKGAAVAGEAVVEDIGEGALGGGGGGEVDEDEIGAEVGFGGGGAGYGSRGGLVGIGGGSGDLRLFFFGFCLLEIGEPGAGPSGELVVFNGGNGGGFAGGEVKIEQARFRHFVGLFLGFAGGGEGGLGGVGAGDEVRGVGGEGEADGGQGGGSVGVGGVGLGGGRREGADGEALLATGGEFAHDDFAVAVLRHEGVGEPAAVAGEGG